MARIMNSEDERPQASGKDHLRPRRLLFASFPRNTNDLIPQDATTSTSFRRKTRRRCDSRNKEAATTRITATPTPTPRPPRGSELLLEQPVDFCDFKMHKFHKRVNVTYLTQALLSVTLAIVVGLASGQQQLRSAPMMPMTSGESAPLQVGAMNMQPFDPSIESRASNDQQSQPQLMSPQSMNALNLLANLLNSYPQQQNGQQHQQRGAPMPGGQHLQRAGQSGNGPQVSTPMSSPFAANGHPNAQFQPTPTSALNSNNNRRIPLPQNNIQRMNHNSNQNQNQNQLFLPSSSPPTPYLTLTRLSNMVSNNQNQNQGRPMGPQPLNTFPLGNPMGNQQSYGSRAPVSALMPPRGMQPNPRLPPTQQFNQQVTSQSPPQQRPPSIALPPNSQVQAPAANQVKPVSGGFAPSGPPPSPMANNAMVVVQSPPNAIGLIPATSTASGGQPVDESSPTTTAPSSTSTTSARPPTQASTFPTTTSTGNSSFKNDAEISNKQELDADQVPASSWSPVDANRSAPTEDPALPSLRPRVSLAPSPDIVTVPPGYNPDAPQNSQPESYDISVSTKMGGSSNKLEPQEPQPSVQMANATSSTSEAAQVSPSTTLDSDSLQPQTDLSTMSVTAATIAPTAVTTIIWSPPPSDTNPSSSVSSGPPIVQPTRTYDSRVTIQTAVATATSASIVPTQPPSRIRDNSLLNDDPNTASNPRPEDPSSGVVYGKAQNRESKPTAPPNPEAGRPFIKPAPLDSQVRPFTAGTGSQPLIKSNHGHLSPFDRQKASKPLGSQSSPMHVGSGFSIVANGNQTMPTGDIQDYVANQPPPALTGSFQITGDASQEPTISAQGGPDPASFDLSAQDSSASLARANSSPSSGASNNTSATSNESVTSPSPTPRARRPTFKPKPAEPPIRIDSCIVGDESSCDQSHNERCVTEYGISSCHCKPGFARLSQLRGFCSPVSALQMTMRIERLSDDRKLAYNYTLDSPNSEEYQYLEFETIQALAGAFQQTALARQFMGARVNKFFEHRGKVWANVSVNLEQNNVTKSSKIQQIAGQELSKLMQSKQQKPLGDSTIVLDGSKESVSRLTDINECASPELNDCSKQATCTNDFGGFHCQCLPGYEDKHASKTDKSKHGRVCLGCSASYCTNRGECSIVDGQKQCKCRPNFIGSRCDIDSEVMAVAVGGSLVGVIILIVTFWCLFVFNRRWKREQQKMDAMSATSGLTYNYVNSSTNSLMSPTRIIGGLQRSAGGHHTQASASNYTQRFGVALGGGGRSGQHYAPDQQAIMGSTSSGSSAASQPIACNPYAPNYHAQYEDAGLLIAPASTGSSEQTSPSGNSYRGAALAQHMAGTAYTLSGHHHHHHHHSHNHSLHHHLQHGKSQPQLTQFHPADYRTMSMAMQQPHCPAPAASSYEGANRWRTLQQQQDNGKQSSALVGYYLSPDMLVNHQQQQQQLYASPQRELCIDTDANLAARSRRQQGRAGSSGQTLRSRSQGPRPSGRNSLYSNAIDYEHERPI